MGDMGLLIVAAYLAVLIVFYGQQFRIRMADYYGILPVMVITAGILFNVNGLFSLSRKRYGEVLLSLGVALFNLYVILVSISFFLRNFFYSRSVLLIMMILQLVLLATWKYIFWRVERALSSPRNVLLVGNRDECERVLGRLHAHPQLNYHVRYICTECENEPWDRVAADIDTMILCSDLPLKVKAEIVHFGHTHGKQVLLIPDFYGLFCNSVELDKIDDIPVFRTCYLKPTLEQRSLKRILDVMVSGTALLFLWPVMLLVAVAIKIDSPGPVLYSQVRTGRDEKVFKVFKFRSMRQDAEKITGPVLAAEDDPRITRLGRFLRATRLDELPQLMNVLFGDMSIVGPRPERPFFVEQFKQEIPEYVYRHNVKPGITGMAQVFGKYNTTPYDKLVYDLMYIQKCNVLTDLVIMLQTMRVLVTKSSTEGVKNDNISFDLSLHMNNQTNG
jgi:exopolysaccharide biosynthesis polyprenyl glycosylphosphotransferase